MPFSWPLAYPSRDLVRRLSLVTGPAAEPIAVLEAKTHNRITWPDEDALVEGLIAAAREHVERQTGRQLMTATWKLTLDRFPCGDAPVEIPVAPLLSVVSVKYRDLADVLQTWTNTLYVVDAPSGPYATAGRVYPALNEDYPATAGRPNAVEVQFTAGYGSTPETVPQALRQAMLLLIGHWYANRESVDIGNITSELPFAAEALLGSFTRVASLIR